MSNLRQSNLNNLKEKDFYSLLLFALYKLKDDAKYSTLSEMAFILDKSSLLKLCEYFGGMTITIPTITEVEKMIYALSVYQQVNLEGNQIDSCLSAIKDSDPSISAVEVKECYYTLVDVLDNFSFGETADEQL